MSAITSAWSGLRIIMRFCALLCAQGLVAPAYSEDVIQFSYAADTASIVARGQIDVGAADRFQQFLDINRVDSGGTVYLHSPGGILTEGVKIGRIIRKRGLRTSISDGGTSSGACYSACAIAFVGGITRTIPPGSRYGVHRFRYSGVPDTALGAAKQVEIAQITSARLIQYFSEMGVDSELFTTSALTASNDMARPSLEQLKRWRVTTDSRPIALWSVDDSDGAVYLRGRLNDGNKNYSVAIGCKARNLFLYGYFDAEELGSELASDALVLDAERIRIDHWRAGQHWSAGTLVVTYNLDRDVWSKINAAHSIGVIVHSPRVRSGQAGIDKLSFERGILQRDEFARRCLSDMAPIETPPGSKR